MKHSIISVIQNLNVKNWFLMFIKSRKTKIAFLSLCTFVIGASITAGTYSLISSAENKTGIGGQETIADPNLYSIIEKLNAETDEQAADNELLGENLEDFGDCESEVQPLTYLTYRVKKGDMIGLIADRYNVTQDTIISVNAIKQSRLIQVGQFLKIPSIPGIIYTVKADGETPESVAVKYKVDAQKCAFVNNLNSDSSLSAGTSIFVPDAELDWTTRQEINGDLFHKPLKARYWLSSPYGWRDSPFNPGKRTFHGGVDMAVARGTPIYPALDGKVTSVGYNAVYGNYVIVTHHSGYKTLYAHMDQTTCKTGNFVYKNTMIGRVGSTGQSTGPHLHFTVYKNGKTVNPLALVN